jgi:hypothetical protein
MDCAFPDTVNDQIGESQIEKGMESLGVNSIGKISDTITWSISQFAA